MFHTKFHLPRPIFYSPSSKCTRTGERASFSFPHCSGSDTGLVPSRSLAIIWTNAIWLLIGPSWTNFSEIWIKIHVLTIFIPEINLENVVCKTLAILSQPQCDKQTAYNKFALEFLHISVLIYMSWLSYLLIGLINHALKSCETCSHVIIFMST